MIWEREVQIHTHPREPGQEVLRDTGLWPQSHIYEHMINHITFIVPTLPDNTIPTVQIIKQKIKTLF